MRKIVLSICSILLVFMLVYNVTWSNGVRILYSNVSRISSAADRVSVLFDSFSASAPYESIDGEFDVGYYTFQDEVLSVWGYFVSNFNLDECYFGQSEAYTPIYLYPYSYIVNLPTGGNRQCARITFSSADGSDIVDTYWDFSSTYENIECYTSVKIFGTLYRINPYSTNEFIYDLNELVFNMFVLTKIRAEEHSYSIRDYLLQFLPV